MSRLSDTLGALKQRGQKAMGLFLTSGFPSREATPSLLRALDAGGADFIELGMPFSDPLAEGLPIQRSSARALAGGVRMEDTLRFAEGFRAQSATPLVLMGYVNPIMRFGVSNFCRAACSSGVDGLIVPDLPPEESAILVGEARAAGLDVIHLLAPNTPNDRAAEIDQITTGFVYAVSVTGVTGSGLHDRMDAVERYLRRARRLVRHHPLLVGFGIKTHADAMRLCQHTDGFIVGSALVSLVERIWEDELLASEERLLRVEQFARSLKGGSS